MLKENLPKLLNSPKNNRRLHFEAATEMKERFYDELLAYEDVCKASVGRARQLIKNRIIGQHYKDMMNENGTTII